MIDQIENNLDQLYFTPFKVPATLFKRKSKLHGIFLPKKRINLLPISLPSFVLLASKLTTHQIASVITEWCEINHKVDSKVDLL